MILWWWHKVTSGTVFCAFYIFLSWWRHHMETFSALLALCAGNSPVTGEFPSQRPVTRSFDILFDLRLNKRLSKQSGRRWLQTPWRSWHHCNDVIGAFQIHVIYLPMHFIVASLAPRQSHVWLPECQRNNQEGYGQHKIQQYIPSIL